MKLIALILAFFAFTSFATDQLVIPKHSGKAFLKDNSGNIMPALVGYTTDGNSNLQILAPGGGGVDDNLIIPKNSGNMFVQTATDTYLPAMVLYTTDGNGTVQPVSLSGGGSGGSGTVTSVGLSLPSIFSISGSPVTASGTLSGSLVEQVAGKVFAAPASSAGAPEFRSLQASDIPALDYLKTLSTSTSGVTVTSTGTTASVDIATAGASTAGLLSSTNWNQFNNKPSGAGGLYGLAYWNSTSNLSALTELKITTSNPKRITMGGTGTAATLSNVKFASYDTVNAGLRNVLQNLSSGVSASTGWSAIADTGTETSNFVEVGIKGSGYADSNWTISSALDSYLLSKSSNLSIGTGAEKDIIFHTGGTLAANEKARISSTGLSVAGTIKAVNNQLQIGVVDPFDRTQIWNYGANSVLRLGSLAEDGDAPGDISSEGIVVYGLNSNDAFAGGDFGYARIKSNRFGLYNSIADSAGYIFRVDPSSLYLADDSYNKTFQVTRSTGAIKTTLGAGYVQSDASGNLSASTTLVYTASDTAHWVSPAPTTVQQAIDRLAKAVSNNGANPIP